MVGFEVAFLVGRNVGATVGKNIGNDAGLAVGLNVFTWLGAVVGVRGVDVDGFNVGPLLDIVVGLPLGVKVGRKVGRFIGFCDTLAAGERVVCLRVGASVETKVGTTAGFALAGNEGVRVGADVPPEVVG